MPQEAEQPRSMSKLAEDIYDDVGIIDTWENLRLLDNEQKAAISDALLQCHNVIADIKQELGE